eukprot:s1313_g5.t2
MAGVRRQLLSIGEDEDEEPMFKVKKSRLSKQMAATKAPADLPSSFQKKSKEAKQDRPDPRKSRRSRPEAAEVDISEIGDVVEATEPLTEPAEGFDDAKDMEDIETSAVQAARLARAQRQAARDAPRGAQVPQGDSRARIKALAAAAQRELNDGDEEPEDLAEAWALRQLEVGLHRRRTGQQAPVVDMNLDEEIAQLDGRGDTAAKRRDGVAQVQKAAERVAKGHDSAKAVRKEESVLWAPSEAMAKLWDTMKTLEGSAENRDAKIEELKSQRDAAQDELREIERQDKQTARSLRCVRELEEIAWSLGGLLDEKSAKCKQASTMLSQIEEGFVKRRSRRRVKDLMEVLKAAGASLTRPLEAASDDEKDEQAAEAAKAATQRSARRLERRKSRAKQETDGWDTSDHSEEDGLEQTAKDRRSFCAAVHRQLLEDVSEDFTSASAVLKALKSAKQKLQDEYRQAFVHLSLPEVFSFFVEHSTFWWDPLSLVTSDDEKASWGPRKAMTSTQLEAFDWFEEMASFTELMGDDDPDTELVPKIVQKCIFPEVARRLRTCWDPTSLTQTVRAAALLDECLLFEVGEDGAFNELLLAALERLRHALQHFAPEVFVPGELVPEWYRSDARKRLLWRSCKIAHCAAQLEGRIADEHLAPLVLHEIFATRIAPHLQGPRLHVEELDLLERFLAALPERWLDPLPAALAPLRDCLGPRAPKGAAAQFTKDRAHRLLQRMKCFDEAEALKL